MPAQLTLVQCFRNRLGSGQVKSGAEVSPRNVWEDKSNLRFMGGDYDDRVMRPRALGRFRDLLIASATHPAMIRYHDNEQNAAGRISCRSTTWGKFLESFIATLISCRFRGHQ